MIEPRLRWALLLLLGGCSTAPALPEFPDEHPASVRAAESPPSPKRDTLVVPEDEPSGKNSEQPTSRDPSTTDASRKHP